MANDLQAQLEEHLREFHSQNQANAGRFGALETRHGELHSYISGAYEVIDKIERKLQTNTRAVESLAITTGKVLDRQDQTLTELVLVRKVLMKIARKLGVS